MNEFILDYLENDKTNRAIMLTGGWGSGKSYYVKNTLKPFLESTGDQKHECAIISLYGLTDASDISKAIYMEFRTITKEPESEPGKTAKVVGKIVGKGLFNGLVGKIGFDIGSISDEDLQKIYTSIDLSNKLIILEDIERTQIDTADLFGYINNMCENNGVKMLLVTNEDEILTTYETTDDNGKQTTHYTESAILYMRTKEKTVGDTIHFTGSYLNAIQQIIHSFGDTLKEFDSQVYYEEIWDAFTKLNAFNLRAFIYACQKCKNILDFADGNGIDISHEIKRVIFLGIIAFTQRQSSGSELHFDRSTFFSAELGLNNEFPLFYFCYDYIVNQQLSKEEIAYTIGFYIEYRQNSEWNSEKDCDIITIKHFYLKTEAEIKDAILRLPAKLEQGYIPYCDYGALFNHLLAIKYEARLNIDIRHIENKIVSKLSKSTSEITLERIFNSEYHLTDKKALSELDAFKKRISLILQKNDAPAFSYAPESLDSFYTNNIEKLKEKKNSIGFACQLDTTQFIEMLKVTSAQQIHTVRQLFSELYLTEQRKGQVRKHYISQNDLLAIKALYNKCFELSEYTKYDRIQKLQIDWFIQNLKEIIDKFGPIYDSNEAEYSDDFDDYRGDWINDPDHLA